MIKRMPPLGNPIRYNAPVTDIIPLTKENIFFSKSLQKPQKIPFTTLLRSLFSEVSIVQNLGYSVFHGNGILDK